MKVLKYLLLFLTFFIIATICVVGYFEVTKKISTVDLPKLPSVSFSDLVKFSRFSLDKAPSNSLVGTITSMNGDVFYEPRLATESAKIVSPVTIQQGESLTTDENGSLVLNFKDTAELSLENNSGLNIVQTLPADLVFQQTLGSIEYKKLGQIPVTIRVGHLLAENDGEIKISFTKDSPVTTIVMIDGSAVIAYNNLNNNSKVINLTAGQTLTFNEGSRKVVLE